MYQHVQPNNTNHIHANGELSLSFASFFVFFFIFFFAFYRKLVMIIGNISIQSRGFSAVLSERANNCSSCSMWCQVCVLFSRFCSAFY